jgi:L-iditol 2-dehydrogenase
MKAVVLEDKGVMTYKNVPTPSPSPGCVTLQVKATSICGSDVSRYAKGHRLYPLILGHEVAGVITAVGNGVSKDLLGKHAAVIPLVPCFQCPECQREHYSACHRYSFIGSRQSGGFADYVEIPERNALIVPDEMPFEAAAIIEPSTVARHILDLGKFREGQTAVVLGAGSIGLMVVQWLRILKASRIICTDVSADNLVVAQRLGAHVMLDPRKSDIKTEVARLTGDGADISIEAAGAPQTLAQTVQVTRPRGSVVLGGNQPLDESLPMQFIEDVMRKELTLSGCFMSYSAPFPGHEWTDTIRSIQTGELNVEAMISHRLPMADAPDVFGEIAAHRLSHQKIILLPEQGA